MAPVEPHDGPAQYLREALRERGIEPHELSRTADGYRVRVDGRELEVPGPSEGARVLLWAMTTANDVAHKLD